MRRTDAGGAGGDEASAADDERGGGATGCALPPAQGAAWPPRARADRSRGALRKLVKNTSLKRLVGGVEQVILGDMQAKAEARRHGLPSGSVEKLKAQRAGPPVFETIVEVRRGALNEWRVVTDAGDAVDRILDSAKYRFQIRTRNPSTGDFFLELDRA